MKHTIFGVIEQFDNLDHELILRHITKVCPDILVDACDQLHELGAAHDAAVENATPAWRTQVVELLDDNSVIKAVKTIRENTGLSLYESKRTADLLRGMARDHLPLRTMSSVEDATMPQTSLDLHAEFVAAGIDVQIPSMTYDGKLYYETGVSVYEACKELHDQRKMLDAECPDELDPEFDVSPYVRADACGCEDAFVDSHFGPEFIALRSDDPNVTCTEVDMKTGVKTVHYRDGSTRVHHVDGWVTHKVGLSERLKNQYQQDLNRRSSPAFAKGGETGTLFVDGRPFGAVKGFKVNLRDEQTNEQGETTTATLAVNQPETEAKPEFVQLFRSGFPCECFECREAGAKVVKNYHEQGEAAISAFMRDPSLNNLLGLLRVA